MINFKRASTATYINKQGVLTVAQANEPRFEKEGILIERTSTNLYTPDSMWQSGSDGKWSITLETVRLGDVDFKLSKVTNPKGTVGTHCYAYSFYLPKDNVGIYSVTAIYKILPDMVSISDLRESQVGFSPNFKVVDGLPTVGSKGCTILGYNVFGDYVLVKYTIENPTNHFTNFVINFSKSTHIVEAELGIVQIEKLPFATSYIPTSGSAVTRARDEMSASYSWERKVGTIAFDIEIFGYKTLPYADFITLGTGRIESIGDTNGLGWWGFNGMAGTDSGVRANEGLFKTAMTFNEKTLRTYVDGKVFAVNGQPNTGITPSTTIDWMKSNNAYAAHLKNFRIWHTALTPEQISTL